jgi:3-methyladenine DNA glycosylase AlkD
MNILSAIRKDLKNRANKKNAEGMKRYFQETIKTYGVSVPDARNVARKYYPEIRQMDLEDIIKISESLLKDGYMEEGIVAFELLEKSKRNLNASALTIFEKWLDKYVSNWAHCDELSAHLIGYIIEKNPEISRQLIRWTSSSNRWKRRSAAVSFVLLARNGKNLSETLEIASRLKTDNDDMVQKGVGWLLKEASKKDQKAIVSFVRNNKSVMPRTTLRYAIEKMPEKTRKELMQQ